MTGGRHPRRGLAAVLPVLILFMLSAAATASPALRPFSAEYNLSHGFLEIARVQVRLSLLPGGRYEYSAHTRPVGLTALLRSDQITEISRGRIDSRGIRPEHYSYRHDRPEHPRRMELHFDWPELRVTNQSEGSKWIMAIEPGTQDKFSQQLALMLALSGGQREISLPVADGGRLKQYRFSPAEETEIETPAGHFRSIRMLRSKTGRNARASFWLAPELGYLPVRVERQEKDGLFLMELTRIQRGGPKENP